MSAAALLHDLTTAGIRLELTERGTLHYQGSQEVVSQWLPEIFAHKADLVALLTAPANDPPRPFYATADDRRQCHTCLNLGDDEPGNRTYCLAARRGKIPMTARHYQPDPDAWMRCVGYRPNDDDSDQRPGAVRWEGLYRRLQEGP